MTLSKLTDIRDIDIIPGVNISLFDVLKLMLRYWHPSSSALNTWRRNLESAMNQIGTIAGRSAICDFISSDAAKEAIADAVASVVGEKLTQISSTVAHCNGCSTSKTDIIANVIDIVMSSFSLDGVNYAGIIEAVINEVVCCAVQISVKFAISRLNPLNLITKLRKRCKEVLVQAGDVAKNALNTAEGGLDFGTASSTAALTVAGVPAGAKLVATAVPVQAQTAPQATVMALALSQATLQVRSPAKPIKHAKNLKPLAVAGGVTLVASLAVLHFTGFLWRRL